MKKNVMEDALQTGNLHDNLTGYELNQTYLAIPEGAENAESHQLLRRRHENSFFLSGFVYNQT